LSCGHTVFVQSFVVEVFVQELFDVPGFRVWDLERCSFGCDGSFEFGAEILRCWTGVFSEFFQVDCYQGVLAGFLLLC